MTDERLAELMVKVADGAATGAEREELMAWIADKPALRAELDAHRALKATTDGWMARLEADLMEDRARASGPRKAIGGAGVWLLVAGLAVLTFASPVLAIQDPEVPLGIKAGMGLTFAGAAVLLTAVIVGRLKDRKSDPYTEVIR